MSLLSIEWLSMMRPTNGSVYATRDSLYKEYTMGRLELRTSPALCLRNLAFRSSVHPV